MHNPTIVEMNPNEAAAKATATATSATATATSATATSATARLEFYNLAFNDGTLEKA